ncbi:MAG: complex I NDUFA9 subunit family protein [Gammaproteobacteria bacterium]
MHTIRDKRIVLFGGTGFLGRELAVRLANGGAYVTVAARHPQRSRILMVLPRVNLRRGDVRDAAFVESVLAGQDAVVNLVGILDGSPKRMRALHVDWPARLAQAGAGLSRLVHVSAAGADPQGASLYLRTKGEGENRIHAARAPWTVIAPSAMFGPGDSFFNRFAMLLRLSPGIMPVVRPQARFTPVYVEDVAEAIARVLLRDDLAGEHLQFGGPQTWAMREILVYIREQIRVRRLLLDLPDGLAKMQGIAMSLLPGKPFSLDQFRTLTVDSIADTGDFALLGIKPSGVRAIVPQYLGKGRRQERFDRFRRKSDGAPISTSS